MLKLNRRRSLAEVAYLWVSALAGAAFAFGTQIVLARTLSPADYGRVNAVLLVYTVLAPMAGMGVAGYWLRTFGALGAEASAYLKPSFKLSAIGTILATGLAASWAILAPHDENARIIYFVLIPVLWAMVAVDLLISICQIQQRYIRVSIWQSLINITRFAVLALAALSACGLETGSASVLISLTAASILLAAGRPMWNFYRTNTRPTLVSSDVRSVFSESWAFALLPFMNFIYFQGGILFVFYFLGEVSSAYYVAAFTIVSATYVLPAAIFQRYLLPKYHRWYADNREMLLLSYRFGNFVMLLIGGATLLGLLLAGPLLVRLAYGEEYAPAASILAILTFAVPLRYVASSVGATLLTAQNVRRKIGYMAITALASVGLTVLFIAWFGFPGAALAAVASDAVLLILFLYGARQHVFGSDALRGWFDVQSHLRVLGR
ncbi:oligosaccharide flippase family protein [Aurantimonas sp. E1-2-R+4]|uniref:oligosaccharide flippase family protein n=1 Tax=Aurantimonas sp. E1-2-R+4 TaxID=3113714 RepID=UPI002F931884